MNLAIYGAGGSGKEVYDLLDVCNSEREKWDEIVFLDDISPEGMFHEYKKISFDSFARTFSPEKTEVVIAIGEPKNRKILYEKIKSAGYSFANLIHRTALVSKTAILAKGIVVQEGALISSDAVIEDNVYINHRALIGHDVKVGMHSQISANVSVAGSSVIGECVFAGVSACIRDHTTIGDNTIISMGAVVLRDVNPYMIVMGNPAREIRRNEDGKVF